jgi:hypothetical protein
MGHLPSVIQSGAQRLTIVLKGEKVTQFALPVYESPEAFATRNSGETDPYLRAWRAYYKALVESGIYVGGRRQSTCSAGDRNYRAI